MSDQTPAVTVGRYGPPGRRDFEVGLNDEHVFTFTRPEAEALYVALGSALGKADQ